MSVTKDHDTARVSTGRRATTPARSTRGPVAGRYRLDLATGAWHWSAELHHLLGLTPGTVEPSIDLLLSHLAPADHHAALAGLAECGRGASWSGRQRFRRADGSELQTAVVLEPETDAGGAVTGLTGVVVAVEGLTAAQPSATVSEDRVQALETEVEQLRTAMASRAQIEQAKGVLMLLTGFTEQACFDLLGHMASHTHRKVRDIALQITASAAGRVPLPADVRAILRDACPPDTSVG